MHKPEPILYISWTLHHDVLSSTKREREREGFGTLLVLFLGVRGARWRGNRALSLSLSIMKEMDENPHPQFGWRPHIFNLDENPHPQFGWKLYILDLGFLCRVNPREQKHFTQEKGHLLTPHDKQARIGQGGVFFSAKHSYKKTYCGGTGRSLGYLTWSSLSGYITSNEFIEPYMDV